MNKIRSEKMSIARTSIISYGKRRLVKQERLLLFLPIVLVLIIGGRLLYTHKVPHRQLAVFPANLVHQMHGFTLYYVKPGFSSDFRLDSSTIDYQGGVLIFSLKNPSGDVLVFTEEAIPPGYDLSQLQADQQFQTGYGQAFITDAALRTTGTLFTSDRTWILINAPTPIGADLMQQILEALQPYH